jgi:hypothetical protein
MQEEIERERKWSEKGDAVSERKQGWMMKDKVTK